MQTPETWGATEDTAVTDWSNIGFVVSLLSGERRRTVTVTVSYSGEGWEVLEGLPANTKWL